MKCKYTEISPTDNALTSLSVTGEAAHHEGASVAGGRKQHSLLTGSVVANPDANPVKRSKIRQQIYPDYRLFATFDP
jgi:hypothetical protein